MLQSVSVLQKCNTSQGKGLRRALVVGKQLKPNIIVAAAPVVTLGTTKDLGEIHRAFLISSSETFLRAVCVGYIFPARGRGRLSKVSEESLHLG